MLPTKNLHLSDCSNDYLELESQIQLLESLYLVPSTSDKLEGNLIAEKNAIEGAPAQTKSNASTKEYIGTGLLIFSCLFVLSAIMLPCFIGAQLKAKAAAVKGNMRTVQIAAESFATANNGIYASRMSQLLPFFPGGSNSIGGSAGTLPFNPVQGASVAGVIDGSEIASGERILELRTVDTDKSYLKAGQVGYFPMANGKSYAIIGADSDARDVPGVGGKVFVLSNQ